MKKYSKGKAYTNICNLIHDIYQGRCVTLRDKTVNAEFLKHQKLKWLIDCIKNRIIFKAIPKKGGE